jgi:hypothetical protein
MTMSPSRQSPFSGSRYSARDGSPGDPFGAFSNQRVLGHPCTIRVEPLPDGDPRAEDLLGWPMRRGGPAIHISGLDPYGAPTGPGFVRELGLYAIDWLGREDHPSGLGCRGPEAVALATWDGVHQSREQWAHHAFWGRCRGYVTARGIYNLFGPDKAFTPMMICSEMNRRDSQYRHYTDRQHVSAVRRLLETMIGVSNVSAGAIVQDPTRPLWGVALERAGRWGYRWPMIPAREGEER